MKRHKCSALTISLACLLALFCAAEAAVLPQGRLNVALFPVRNETPLKVWKNRFYPGDVLGAQLGDHIATLLRRSPLINVYRLGEEDERQWLQGVGRQQQIGVRFTLVDLSMRKNDTVGSTTKGVVTLRMTVFDGLTGEERNTAVIRTKDSRWTPMYRDDPAEFPRWKSFSKSVYWASCQEAAREGVDDLLRGYTGYQLVGRIIAPTADSTEKRREYIVSLGKYQSLQPGDVLPVTRSDTYITVDPENPVVILPKTIGKVKVTFVKPSEAVVVVVDENEDNPVQLKDLIYVPVYGPRKEGTLE